MIDLRTAAYGAFVLRVALGVRGAVARLDQAPRVHARRHRRLLRLPGLSGLARLGGDADRDPGRAWH